MARDDQVAAGAILAVDLGGTRLRFALFGTDDQLHWEEARPTPRDEPAAFVPVLREAIARAPVAPEGVAIALAGPVSYAERRAVRTPNLPGWDSVLDAQALADALRLPVLLANDADAAAVGEHRFGAGRGVDEMVYVTCSTGVGAGVIIGGKLLHGRRSLAEVGFMLAHPVGGATATVEELAAGPAIERLAGAPPEAITERARAGDTIALAALRAAADALALGVWSLVAAFMPERVVIGGGVALGAGELLLGPVRERVERQGGVLGIGPEIVLAILGDSAGLHGALALWRGSSDRSLSIEAPRPALPSGS